MHNCILLLLEDIKLLFTNNPSWKFSWWSSHHSASGFNIQFQHSVRHSTCMFTFWRSCMCSAYQPTILLCSHTDFAATELWTMTLVFNFRYPFFLPFATSSIICLLLLLFCCCQFTQLQCFKKKKESVINHEYLGNGGQCVFFLIFFPPPFFLSKKEWKYNLGQSQDLDFNLNIWPAPISWANTKSQYNLLDSFEINFYSMKTFYKQTSQSLTIASVGDWFIKGCFISPLALMYRII